MLILCGFPVSNYYNKVKLALLEKGVPFQEERRMTGKEAIEGGSPTGKVPFLRTPQGVLCESQAIVDYIEDAFPQVPLYPRDAYERAKCREAIHFIELYLELPARRLYHECFFGGTVSDEVKRSAREELDKGVKALAHVVKFAPFLTGAQFTYADCAAFAHLPLVSQATKRIYGEDFLARVPGVAPYLEQIRARPHAKKANEDRKADIERSVAARKSA